MKDIQRCVYKYVYRNSIIYIGKTDYSLKQRVSGHEKEKKFKKYLDDVEIYFIELKNKAETSFMEKYLINKYKPVLNIVDVYDGDSGIIMCEPEWKNLNEFNQENELLDNINKHKFNKFKKLEYKNGYNTEYIKSLRKKCRCLELNRIFDSLSDASEFVYGSRYSGSQISRSCREGIEVEGYHFEFL